MKSDDAKKEVEAVLTKKLKAQKDEGERQETEAKADQEAADEAVREEVKEVKEKVFEKKK